MKRRTRGNIFVIVLLLIALLGTMALTAPMMLRPAAARLDERIELDRAQAAADAALAEALARIDAGLDPALAREDGSSRATVSIRDVAGAPGERWLVVRAWLAPSLPATPATEGLGPCVALQARVRVAGGRARVVQYLILNRLMTKP